MQRAATLEHTGVPESKQWIVQLLAAILFGGATAGGILLVGVSDMLAYWQINSGVSTPAEFWGVLIVCFSSPFCLLFLCLAFSGGMASFQASKSPLQRILYSLFFAAIFLASAILSMTNLLRPTDSYPLPGNGNTTLVGGNADFFQTFVGALFFCISVPLFFTCLYVTYTASKTPSSSSSSSSSDNYYSASLNDSLLDQSRGSAAALRAAANDKNHNSKSMFKGVSLLVFITFGVSIACCCIGPIWNMAQPFYFPSVSPYSVVGTNTNPNATFQFKIYLDVVVFFAYIWGISFLGIVAQLYTPLRNLAGHRLKFGKSPNIFNRFIRGISVGELFVVGSWISFAIWWWNFWYSQFPYTAINSFNESAQIAARTLGQMASLCFAFLMFPVAKNSVWESAFGIPFDRAIGYHRALGYLGFAFTTAHMLVWWIKWAGQGLLSNNFTTIGNLIIQPASTVPAANQGAQNHTDNFTIPLMEITYAGLLIMLVITHYCRRKNWELFRFVHWFAFVFLLSAIVHAWSFWYYFASGGILWLIDRCIRLARGVREVPASSVSLEYSAEIGVTKITMPSSAVANSSWHAGAWMYICVPEVCNVEWHPFSISSSPLSGELTIHAKEQGQGQWTHRLGVLAQRSNQVDGGRIPVQIRADGPYGKLAEDPLRFQNIVLIAGGIGITPLHAILSDLQTRCTSGLSVGSIKRVHLVWTAQRDALISAFSDTIYNASRASEAHSSIMFSFALHSTQKGRSMAAAASSQGADMGRVNISDKIAHLAPFSGTSSDAMHHAMSNILRGRPDLRLNLSMFKNTGSNTLVLVCGPTTMVREASELSLGHNFRFHSESFEF